MTTKKKPQAPVSDEQRDLEAASFLRTAHEMAELIRAGRAARVVLDFASSRRDPDALNVVQDTINLKLTYDGATRAQPKPWLMDAEAVQLFGDGLARVMALRGHPR